MFQNIVIANPMVLINKYGVYISIWGLFYNHNSDDAVNTRSHDFGLLI